MKIVHTMIRVNDLDESLKFYCDGLGMKLLKKREYPVRALYQCFCRLWFGGDRCCHRADI